VKKFNLSLQWKFFLCIVLIVVPTLSIIFTWTGFQNEKQAIEQVVNRARVLARQIILTRQWVTDCGGVMVLGESKGAKDVVSFLDDKLVTSHGWYQRFTPSMVTKKLSQYSLRQDLYRFRLASLNPLNPDNRADDFEKEALNKFRAKGLTELYRFDNHGENRHFHYVAPLYLEKGCIKCHHAKGEAPNIIRGGLSVILPIDDMASAVKKNHLKLAVSGTVLIFLSLFTLFVLTRRFVVKPLKDMERMTSEIGKGNLDARVNIRTGDEFQKLGEAFNTMAQNLAETRESMETKVSQATCELSEANRELKTLDKLKSDFLANMSHELRSPLTVLRGGVDYLSRTLRIEDNRNYLHIIDKNLNRLIHLVSDLFDFTKIEAKKIEWSFEPENLAVLIEEVIEIISPLSLDKKITINYEKPVDIPVEIDVERIEQVMVNLIENAIKFSDPETEIQVRINDDPQSATVSVKDHGIGIPQGNLETIFDKFSTVPSGRDGNPEGTGLGLAICKAIIEAHGGRIWAESVKGVSSTFYFTLPKQRRQYTP
jgi:signal transduction histidine kinase